jgi:hypothetical protein
VNTGRTDKKERQTHRQKINTEEPHTDTVNHRQAVVILERNFKKTHYRTYVKNSKYVRTVDGKKIDEFFKWGGGELEGREGGGGVQETLAMGFGFRTVNSLGADLSGRQCRRAAEKRDHIVLRNGGGGA